MEHDVYLVLAVVGSVLLLLQVVLQVFGVIGDMDGVDGGADVDVDADVDIDGDDAHSGHGNWFFGMLSFKALCAFAALFGLTGLALKDSGMPTRVIGATAAGSAAMIVVAFLMRSLSRLGASGTIDIRNAVGSTAAVYLTIPGGGTGAGKVTVEIQGRSLQLRAVTDGEQITTGARVMVTEVESGGTLKVTRT